jgi:hypothetical protein
MRRLKCWRIFVCRYILVELGLVYYFGRIGELDGTIILGELEGWMEGV